MLRDPVEIIDFIAYSNRIIDLGRVETHEKTTFVTGFTAVLISGNSRFEFIANSNNFENPRHQELQITTKMKHTLAK